ncbi:hypothetical protein JQ609_34805 [Bradyrhizobium sp. AUGA SZCCT0169]|nr:hypothetical protein [Bradyrhizobium sp. AUGA SZCCT0169]
MIGVPGANGRGGPSVGTPTASLSTNLGLHGPAINKRTVTAMTTTAAPIAQLILLIRTSPPLYFFSNRPRRARFLLEDGNSPIFEGPVRSCRIYELLFGFHEDYYGHSLRAGFVDALLGSRPHPLLGDPDSIQQQLLALGRPDAAIDRLPCCPYGNKSAVLHVVLPSQIGHGKLGSFGQLDVTGARMR